MNQKAIYPKLKIIDGFLGQEKAQSLFEIVQHSLEFFSSTQIGSSHINIIDKSYRDSIVFVPDIELDDGIMRKIRSIKDNCRKDIGVDDFEISKTHVEFVIHKDGGFYKRHIDTHTGNDEMNFRVMTAVYYFHHVPRTFEGGNIRFFPITGGQEGDCVDVSPDHDRLVVFPSFFPHEVMPVRSPLNGFEDWRFSINVWFSRARSPAARPATRVCPA